MSAAEVAIIANVGANIASLRFALERLGANSQVSADPGHIRSATHVILPGVGAAADAMRRLRQMNLHTLIPSLAQPVLGICLGMQLLFEASEEGQTECLGIIPGRANRFEAAVGRPVPHMGWNTLKIERSSAVLQGLAHNDGLPWTVWGRPALAALLLFKLHAILRAKWIAALPDS